MTKKPPPTPAASLFGLAVLAVGAATSLTTFGAGCGHGGTACKVVDLVHDNCAWIKYLDEDGRERQADLSKPEEMDAFLRAQQARRAKGLPTAGGGR